MKNSLGRRVRRVTAGIGQTLSVEDVCEVIKIVGTLDKYVYDDDYVQYRAYTPDTKISPHTKMPEEYVILREFCGPKPDRLITKEDGLTSELDLISEQVVLNIKKDGVMMRVLKFFLEKKEELCLLHKAMAELESIQQKLYRDEVKREEEQVKTVKELKSLEQQYGQPFC